VHNFIQNLAECTKLDGYFIGTCFDGQKVFQKLNGINQHKSFSIVENDTKKLIFEIEKKYNTSIVELEMNENSIGLPIIVFQESIGQPIMEYLVNFEYFEKLMRDYGFELIKSEEAKIIGFTSASDTFDSLFSAMKNEAKHKNIFIRDALKMSNNEKDISFLNRYFIFKKVTELSQSTLNNIQNILLEKENTKREIETENNEEDDIIQDDIDMVDLNDNDDNENDHKNDNDKNNTTKKIKKEMNNKSRKIRKVKQKVILDDELYKSAAEESKIEKDENETIIASKKLPGEYYSYNKFTKEKKWLSPDEIIRYLNQNDNK
jgi:hypothetical protein